MYSDALGVHPDQIPQAIEEARRHGVRVEFSADGRAKLDSSRHRAAVAKPLGIYDRNGGYSDPQRR